MSKSRSAVKEEARGYLSYERLSDQVDEIEKRLKEVKRSQIKSFDMRNSLQAQIKEQLNLAKRLKGIPEEKDNQEKIEEKVKRLKEISRKTFGSGGKFIRIFLGSELDFNLGGQTEKIHSFKKEYEKMKLNFTFYSLGITFVLLFFYYSHVLDTIFRVTILYYYVSLSLREEILRANGSNINPWWRWHHYLSIVISIVSISWPETDIYWMFRNHFLYTNIYACILGILQYYYQMKQLYLLKSLGKAKSMDTINLDSPSQAIFLKILVPFILIDILAVFVYTIRLLSVAIAYNAEWQAFVTAAIFIVLCIGNTYTLVNVMLRKIPLFKKIKEKIFGKRKKKVKK